MTKIAPSDGIQLVNIHQKSCITVLGEESKECLKPQVNTAWGEAEGSEPVIWGIFYLLPRSHWKKFDTKLNFDLTITINIYLIQFNFRVKAT